MKRNPILILLMLAMTLPLFAGPVTKEEARKRAAEFFANRGLSAAADKVQTKSVRSRSTGNQVPAYYVFNTAEAEGFVIVSGDDRTDAILGYAEQGVFDEASAPDNLKAWLQGYAEQIASLEDVEAGAVQRAANLPARAAIAPMLRTKWNQDAPYNTFSPVIDGTRCPAGCVATAAAQIMYFNKWPQDAVGAQAAYNYDINGYSATVEALPGTTFEWDKMKETYAAGDEDTDNAVATLMRYAGHSVKMWYTPTASGSGSQQLATALTDYFGYDQNLRYVGRTEYGVYDWYALIYSELEAGRVVYYTGGTTSSAHAFVCDGYDGNGFYHMNWGWSGMSDGYFKLEVLNPGEQGIGGSTSAGGYSAWQGAIVGIQPPTGEPLRDKVMTSDDLKVSGKTVSAAFWNKTGGKVKFSAGFALLDADGSCGRVLKISVNELEVDNNGGYSRLSCDLKTAGLPEGTHKIVPVSKETGGSGEWKPTVNAITYFKVVVDVDGRITASAHPVRDFEATEIDFVGSKIAGRNQEVMVTLTNTGDDFVGDLFIFASLTAEKGGFLELAGAAVAGGESDVVPMNFTVPTAGTYNIWITTDSQGLKVVGQTTVEISEPPTGNSMIKLLSGPVVTLGNPVKVEVEIRNNSKEIYAGDIILHLWESVVTNGTMQYVYVKSQRVTPMLGSREVLNHTFNLYDLKPSTPYHFELRRHGDNAGIGAEEDISNGMGDFTTLETGVTGVPLDEPIAVWYNLQGQRIAKPSGSGVYVRNGKKVFVR